MNDLDIYVATHKKVENCINLDGCYKYLFVGANNHTDTYGYICDNDGSDSISEKNSTYCELTGLYWMWKNAPKQKYIGLCHYRRFPSKHRFSINLNKDVLSEKEILNALKDVDVLLPIKGKKTSMNSLCKGEDDLNKCREYKYILGAIKKKCPEYIPELKKVFLDSEMCFGNIFVLTRENFDLYCAWLFDLLFDIEGTIKAQNDEIPREYGYLSEWMLNVWIEKNKLKVKYIPTVFTEEQHDWKFYIKMLKERLKI